MGTAVPYTTSPHEQPAYLDSGRVGQKRRTRDALVEAARRGVKVRVLLDSLGSFSLPAHYWKDLASAGGRFRWFSPFKDRKSTRLNSSH